LKPVLQQKYSKTGFKPVLQQKYSKTGLKPVLHQKYSKTGFKPVLQQKFRCAPLLIDERTIFLFIPLRPLRPLREPFFYFRKCLINSKTGFKPVLHQKYSKTGLKPVLQQKFRCAPLLIRRRTTDGFIKISPSTNRQLPEKC